MKKVIKVLSEELILQTAHWLQPKGIEFFTHLQKKYGTILVTYYEDNYPHVVHFQEGAQVRNFMRDSGLCKGWTTQNLDNNWARLVQVILYRSII